MAASSSNSPSLSPSSSASPSNSPSQSPSTSPSSSQSPSMSPSIPPSGDRYWVGGSGDWSDDGNHWSLTSGGAPNVGNLPTSADNVFIDSSSGFGSGGSIDISGGAEMHDFTSNTGHTYNFSSTGDDFAIYGSYVGEANLTFSANITIRFYTNSPETITSNGGHIAAYVDFNGTSSRTLQDDLSINNVDLTGGSIDANNHNITAKSFYFYVYSPDIPVSINMGSGIWEGAGSDTNWYVEELNGEYLSVVCDTSTIKLNATGTGTLIEYFYGGSNNQTYYNLWFAGNSSGDKGIYTSNTFNEIKDNDTQG